MPPQPSERYGLLRIPAPSARTLTLRYAPLSERDKFDLATWKTQPLSASAQYPGWWEVDIDALGLADGGYEYEFVLDGTAGSPVVDPYADEITNALIYIVQTGAVSAVPAK